MTNVDLLIKNESGHTLLTWRDDEHYQAGWHIPGGIIRYQELMADRIRAVARNELGATVRFEPAPLAIKEIILPGTGVRGHFISFLHRCVLTSPPDSRLEYGAGEPLRGQWMWHETCPENLIAVHEIYREYV
jgi:ADP-ribose pyrophosphatase YjhB (NUDIX family)